VKDEKKSRGIQNIFLFIVHDHANRPKNKCTFVTLDHWITGKIKILLYSSFIHLPQSQNNHIKFMYFVNSAQWMNSPLEGVKPS
jgi:hypothetical protein